MSDNDGRWERDVLEKVAQQGVAGDIVECGVWKGGNLVLAGLVAATYVRDAQAPAEVSRRGLLGTFLTCQHAGLAMVKQARGGCIVNVGDWADVRPYKDYAAYFPSKAAIPGLTRVFAVELGTRNPRVRVNAVLPGPVMLPPEVAGAEREAVIAGTLVKREGGPEHVARAVLHFVENDFVTGACLPVDGGRSVFAHGG